MLSSWPPLLFIPEKNLTEIHYAMLYKRAWLHLHSVTGPTAAPSPGEVGDNSAVSEACSPAQQSLQCALAPNHMASRQPHSW